MIEIMNKFLLGFFLSLEVVSNYINRIAHWLNKWYVAHHIQIRGFSYTMLQVAYS